MTASTPAAPPATAWLDRFFASYLRHRPVNATFIGVHEHDHRLPDLSEAGTVDRVADQGALLDAWPGPDPPGASTADRVDLELAHDFLRIQQWEASAPQFESGNPSVATGEAVFGALSLMLTDFAPVQARATSLVDRLDATAELMSGAADRLSMVPAEWAERAIRECRAGQALFGRGVEAWAVAQGLPPEESEQLVRAGAAARAALRAYAEAVQALPKTDSIPPAGPEIFELLIRSGHRLDWSAQEIARYGREEGEEASARAQEAARDLGYPDAQAATNALADHHPAPEDYLARFERTWEAMRELALERHLVTWPDFPIRYVERPGWVREAAPDLYFLFYRSPPAYTRPPVHEYLVAPLPAPDEPEESTAFLRSCSDAVIKLNHVIHHGGIGHHVQNWHAFRAESRIARMAAVDCASRIAMFCGGTMAEGWACYATDLMAEVGALRPLEQAAEHRSRARMAARAVVDVELHSGQMSLAQAARYYRDHAGMSPAASQAEAVKNSMFPGAALMYLMGTDAVHALRRDMARKLGASFDLRDFHDRFLAHGSIPVPYIAELMLSPDEDA